MRKWYILLFGLLCLGFYTFVGLPPTSANQRPAYLRIDRENRETNVVTWVGRAPRYEVVSYRVLFFEGTRTFVAEEFYVVDDARFEEGNLLEGLTYQYRVRGLDEDGEPISRWSRSVKRTLPVHGHGPNFFQHPPTDVPER